MALKERRLGGTNIKVRRLGFGGIPIQRVSEEEAVKVVRRAHENGINYFDTARVYTTSEARIGKALKDVREEVYIATKSVHRDREGFLEDIETSLEELQSSWIDVYQLHMVSKREQWERISGPGGALEALYEARDAGKVRHLGITSHDPELLMEIVREGIFDVAMIPYNYLTQKPAEELLPLCKKLGVGTVAMKPFGGGAFRHMNAALKYVLGNQDVDVVIPGMMNTRELEENIAVGSGDVALSSEDLVHIEKDRQELGDQFCRACDYCRPCPQGIPISFVLRAEDQFLKLTGWTPGLTRQIPVAEASVASCAKCGECEAKCPYNLPIMDLLPAKMSALVKLLEAQHR